MAWRYTGRRAEDDGDSDQIDSLEGTAMGLGLGLGLGQRLRRRGARFDILTGVPDLQQLVRFDSVVADGRAFQDGPPSPVAPVTAADQPLRTFVEEVSGYVYASPGDTSRGTYRQDGSGRRYTENDGGDGYGSYSTIPNLTGDWFLWVWLYRATTGRCQYFASLSSGLDIDYNGIPGLRYWGTAAENANSDPIAIGEPVCVMIGRQDFVAYSRIAGGVQVSHGNSQQFTGVAGMWAYNGSVDGALAGARIYSWGLAASYPSTEVQDGILSLGPGGY